MIHQTALIDPKAKIHSSVKVGPYSVIGAKVEIEENTEVQSHVSIIGNSKIGKNYESTNYWYNWSRWLLFIKSIIRKRL